MTTTKKLGIWMDHASAHVMEFADPMVTNIVISESTHEEKEKTLQKGESMMHNKNQQQQAEYYRKLSGFIKDHDEVLLFGPTDAKIELLNLLKADKQFDNIKIETMPSEKMTENQEQAYVRNYFSKN
ncbi:MAG: hypothetical protein Q8891_14075 [Bacteroidota bacterium]|nr:hypothetical protein [Bacteroidota bacterium]